MADLQPWFVVLWLNEEKNDPWKGSLIYFDENFQVKSHIFIVSIKLSEIQSDVGTFVLSIFILEPLVSISNVCTFKFGGKSEISQWESSLRLNELYNPKIPTWETSFLNIN